MRPFCRMCNQGLFVRKLQLQCVRKEGSNTFLDFSGIFLAPNDTDQKIVCIPNILNALKTLIKRICVRNMNTLLFNGA